MSYSRQNSFHSKNENVKNNLPPKKVKNKDIKQFQSYKQIIKDPEVSYQSEKRVPPNKKKPPVKKNSQMSSN